jgi:preprotein translocase subunit SecE
VAEKIEKVKQPNAFQKWNRETMGELRKVSWPTREEAWRLTKIVVAVMVIMSAVLGILDSLFSSLITLILS